MNSREATASRRRAGEAEESERSERVSLYLRGDSLDPVIQRKKLLRDILDSFRFRYSSRKWYVCTYHVYKKVSKKVKDRISRLAYLTDKLRKSLPKGSVFYVTRELSEDRSVHYHLLMGIKCDEYGRCVDVPKVRYLRLWKRKWDLNSTLQFHWLKDKEDIDMYGTAPFYVDIGNRFKILDIGAKHRWWKYGVNCYLLYMFKYCVFEKYVDYMVYR